MLTKIYTDSNEIYGTIKREGFCADWAKAHLFNLLGITFHTFRLHAEHFTQFLTISVGSRLKGVPCGRTPFHPNEIFAVIETNRVINGKTDSYNLSPLQEGHLDDFIEELSHFIKGLTSEFADFKWEDIDLVLY